MVRGAAVFLALVGLAAARPLVGHRRPDGLPTIAEVFHPDAGIDDFAIYHPEWFTEASADDPEMATRYLLTKEAAEDGAVCLDGTPSAYYFRPGNGTGANKGGGWCESLDSCLGRSKTDLGSSKNYPATASLGSGYFSSDPTVNPMMYNWNMVFMRYCDGNSFSGNNASSTPYQGTTLHWRGSHILTAQINALLTQHGLNIATDVVVSGCSAGGLATFLHCDHWAENIAAVNAKAKVVCMPDSGFFLDYQGPPQYHTGMIWAFNQQNSTVGVNQDCIAARTKTGDPEECMFAQNNAPYIKTPTFPLQSAFDSWQIANDLGSASVAAIQGYGDLVTQLVQRNLLASPQHGIFLDTCRHHCGMWGDITIDGANQAQALEAWYTKGSQGLPNKGFYNQNQTYPCDACCKPAPILE